MSAEDDARRQTETLANYQALGRAFGTKRIDGTVFRSLLQGLGAEMLRSKTLIEDFRREVLPNETILLLEEWERAVGIPDVCFSGTGTVDQRRTDVLVKLASMGVQTADDFVELAALFGVVAQVTAGSQHSTLPLTLPFILFPDGQTMRHTIVVSLDSALAAHFTYTFPIVFGSLAISKVECIFRRLKPACCDIMFVTP